MAKPTAPNTASDSSDQQADDLPQPPPLKRRLQIAPLQLIGVPLLALLPFLAMFGVFDEHITRVESSNEVIALQVDYPSFQRYKVQVNLTAAVTLLSAESPTTVTLAFDRGYLQNFSNLSFAPEVDELLPDAYVVELHDMVRGEARLVELRMAGERYWRHSGFVSAATEEGLPVTVTVNALIAP